MRKLKLRSSEGNWPIKDVTVALGSQRQGRLHTGAAVTLDRSYILDGATFGRGGCACGGEGSDGCLIANQARILRRVLAVTESASSLTILTHNEGMAMLLEGWRTGEITTTPAWYQAETSNNSFTTVMKRMRNLDAQITIRHVPEDGKDTVLPALAQQLSRMVLFALVDGHDRNWAVIRTKRAIAKLPIL